MNQSDLKNMVVLKNLPSNIVEEAIIILKGNKKVKKPEKIEKTNKVANVENKPKTNDYILKEAEMLVSNYISRIEEKNQAKVTVNKKVNRKYNRLRNYACLASLIVVIETILLLAK